MTSSPRSDIPTNIYIENDHWQILNTTHEPIKILNAYFDTRDYYQQKNQSIVKFIVMIKAGTTHPKIHCKHWFNDESETKFSSIHNFLRLWPNMWGWGINKNGSIPYLLSCLNPLHSLRKIPSSVSLVLNQEDMPTNYFKVIYNLPQSGEKKLVAVCTKLLDYKDDISLMIIEWMEIQLLFGAEKIIFHIMDVHPNILKTLKYYQSIGKVQIELIKWPIGVKKIGEYHLQGIQNQFVMLCDCLYKNMYEYSYLAVLDTDELIVPVRSQDRTFYDLLSREFRKHRHPKSVSGFATKAVFYLFDNNHQGEIQPEVPEDFQFLQHIYRSKKIANYDQGPKSFQSTELVEVIGTHRTYSCLGVGFDCKRITIDANDARMHHYRKGCPDNIVKSCDELRNITLKDKTLWKYKNEIIEKVYKTIRCLKLFIN